MDDPRDNYGMRFVANIPEIRAILEQTIVDIHHLRDSYPWYRRAYLWAWLLWFRAARSVMRHG